MKEPVEQKTPREIDPFSFFAGQASAIRGLGGRVPALDPNYCMHTPYVDVAPGHARFHLELIGLTARTSELWLRVHALQDGSDATLVAHDKIVFSEFENVDVDHAVRFAALEGFRYALFAHFVERGEMVARELRVTLEELPERIAIRANLGERRGTDREATQFAGRPFTPSSRLIADDAPSLRLPMSQPCTPAQIGALGMRGRGADALRAWERSISVAIVQSAGMLVSGAHGLLIDAEDVTLQGMLVENGAEFDALRFASGGHAAQAADEWIATHDAEGAFDFVICESLSRGHVPLTERLDVIGAGLRCLRAGGVGVFMLPYWTGRDLPQGADETAALLTRNEVQRIVLQLIGQSYAVAQMALPEPQDEKPEASSFVLRVHKPG